MTIYLKPNPAVQPDILFDNGAHGIAILSGTGILDFSNYYPTTLDGWEEDGIEFTLYGGSQNWKQPTASISVFASRFATHLAPADLATLGPIGFGGKHPPQVPLPPATVGDVADLGWGISPLVRPQPYPVGYDQGVLRVDVYATYRVRGPRSHVTEIGWSVTICA